MRPRLTRLRVATCARWACLLGGFAAALAAIRAAPEPAAAPPTPPPSGILISVDDKGHVQVTPANPDDDPKAKGLLVWGEGDQVERWAPVGPGWKRPKPPEPGQASAPGDQTRGTAPGAGGVEVTQFTRDLAKIDPEPGTRDLGSLLTPADRGRILGGKPTFRRLPQEKGPPFPATRIVVKSQEGDDADLTVPFAEGQQRVAFGDLKDVPKKYADGLPPGKYQAGGSSFIVADERERQATMGPADELAALLGPEGRRDPLYLQFTLERLLADKNKADYFGDALDLLDSVPEKGLTPPLKQQRERLLVSLEAPAAQRPQAMPTAQAPGEKTGIEDIDDARGQMASGKWDAALKALDRPALRQKAEADRRTAGLALLYRGAILAESGAARADDAQAAFEQAQEALKEAPAADRYRAHVNYGNFLLRSAQDRLHNHAFQAAAGVRQPVLAALQGWLDARQQYESAVALAEQMKSPTQKAAVQVNLARLYALLADTVRALDTGAADKRDFADEVSAASKQADDLAKEAAAAADTPTRAVAEEVRALLAFRAGNNAGVKEAAHRALDAHLEAGHLAGAENVYRTLGLVAAQSSTSDGRSDALRNLRIAHLITESLRERFPPDRSGMTTAGFFARKAYVSQKIVELLLADGKADEALRYAEQAKARSLQDVLAANGARGATRPGDAAAVLAKWPANAAAVEYFLGTDEAYVLVVSPRGKVTAHKLIGADGKPVDPPRLIARVRNVLAEMEGQSQKMLNRLLAKRGYDNRWQDDLHELYNELLPESARKELAGAETLVIVPQHILHYFPFAALVTAKDGEATKDRMARPQFLIEGKADIVYAPSLAAWRPRPEVAARQVSVVGLVQAPGAPALPGVEKDLANLKATFGERVRNSLDGDAATEAAAKKLLAQPGMIVFATHGMNEPDRPLESHLVLLPDENPAAGPDSNDGRLTAGELYALPVKADMVVMSCCYSGLGDRSPLPGDDLFGIQRAFLQSGVRTVVSGQWDVFDRTAPDLTLAFFKNLDAGQGAAKALNEAQRGFLANLRKSPKNQPWLHPYFWAVFTVAGDDRTRVGQ
jgi:CHAT domain-containing protein